MITKPLDKSKIRAYRLQVHHLDKKIACEQFTQAAEVCGFQNSPPGAWETALYNRVDNCTLPLLHDALYQKKSIMQAWSYRGVPLVFPTKESDVFLGALIPHNDEQPWIYTLGITGALAFMQMSFDELLPLVQKAIHYLDKHTIKSKELLDKTLANIVCQLLAKEKQVLWNAPSMYGSPDKHIVGEAVVSFLLRPCSHLSLVVFGERQDNSPTFTSFQNWIGTHPNRSDDSSKILLRKYLHCFGPSTTSDFMSWLGCSTKQAKRLWQAVAEEMQPVTVDGKVRYMLQQDMEKISCAQIDQSRIILLGAHDPYLDLRDRATILENKNYHRLIWKTVANPQVILKDGRIIGQWTTKTQNGKIAIKLLYWETLSSAELKTIKNLAEKYAFFRELQVNNIAIESM